MRRLVPYSSCCITCEHIAIPTWQKATMKLGFPVARHVIRKRDWTCKQGLTKLRISNSAHDRKAMVAGTISKDLQNRVVFNNFVTPPLIIDIVVQASKLFLPL